MRLQAPIVRIFALKSSRGQMGTYYSEAISCPLHVPIAVSAHVRIACNKLPVGGPRQRPWMADEPCSALSQGSGGE